MINFILFPLRVLLNHDTVTKLGLTSLRDERINVCLPLLGERVLDIGCGEGNHFIKQLGRGVGLDPVFNCDYKMKAEDMTFKDESFDTITMMGTLRYIKNKKAALKQIHRVLDKNGVVLVSENSYWMNKLRHALIWWNPYKKMKEDKISVSSLALDNGFLPYKKVRYLYGLSVMYIWIKQ